jgi:hypothetical protein
MWLRVNILSDTQSSTCISSFPCSHASHGKSTIGYYIISATAGAKLPRINSLIYIRSCSSDLRAKKLVGWGLGGCQSLSETTPIQPVTSCPGKGKNTAVENNQELVFTRHCSDTTVGTPKGGDPIGICAQRAPIIIEWINSFILWIIFSKSA